jgi:hypothetical protein
MKNQASQYAQSETIKSIEHSMHFLSSSEDVSFPSRKLQNKFEKIARNRSKYASQPPNQSRNDFQRSRQKKQKSGGIRYKQKISKVQKMRRK